MSDFTTSILVNASPRQAFDAINRPRDWWGREIDGKTDRLRESWTYRYQDMHRSTQQIIELVADRRVVWRVTDSEMTFLDDKSEWNGTQMAFDITPKGEQTEIRFTHVGLVPQVECFEICTNAWTGLIQDSLKSLIETGEGLPYTVE